MELKKIAFIIPSLRGGGAERVFINIIRGLDRSKFEISLILLKKEGPYLKYVPNDIKLYNLNTIQVKKSIIPLIKTINKIKPDIIFSTLGHLNLAILAIRPLLISKPKIIIREANTPSIDLSNKKFYSFLYKKLYSKADKIIAQCKAMRDDLINYANLNNEKVKYIYNPINIDEINILKRENNPFRNNKINLLAVGRLSRQKGFDVLLRAFKVVKEKIPGVHLTILGEGEQKQELISLAKLLEIENDVSFLGFKNNPYPYYYYADLYILSSRWEGFPNSLLEALACGTKVVATDCKSGPREILNNSEYGTLVDVEDIESLADGIIGTLLENKNNSLERAAFFHVKKIIKEYEEIFT